MDTNSDLGSVRLILTKNTPPVIIFMYKNAYAAYAAQAAYDTYIVFCWFSVKDKYAEFCPSGTNEYII